MSLTHDAVGEGATPHAVSRGGSPRAAALAPASASAPGSASAPAPAFRHALGSVLVVAALAASFAAAFAEGSPGGPASGETGSGETGSGGSAGAGEGAAGSATSVEGDSLAALRGALALVTPEAMQALVDELASDAMNGRYYLSDDGHRAARFVASEFEKAGLTPGVDGSWFQPLSDENAPGRATPDARPRARPDAAEAGPSPSPNVMGVRRGVSSRHVLLTAHYDHLKPAASGDDRIFNGADDNAAGVAALILVARGLAALEEPPPFTIGFIAFTGEEYGLVGSKHYVGHPVLPLRELVAVINADMIARGEPDLLYVEGGRQWPWLARAVREANAIDGIGLDLHYDEHPRWLYMSDQGPFVYRRIPSLYLGVEFHPDTHKVTDEADRILPGLASRTARLLLATAVRTLPEVAPPVPADPERESD